MNNLDEILKKFYFSGEINFSRAEDEEFLPNTPKCKECGLWLEYPYAGGAHSWRKCKCKK